MLIFRPRVTLAYHTLIDIYVPPHHQPINPEDEEDVIPDQHGR